MSEQTLYHLRSAQGWVNDPNGPFLYRGVYHIFYQHVPDSAHWTWGLVWGHATSTDLLTWRHHTPALVPTPGHHDQDGCFSGCATLDDEGRPVLLYTDVRRKPCATWLRPSSLTVSEMCEEVQLMAVAHDPDDALLIHWDKVREPLLASPGVPGDVSLNCWRDPFILERPSQQQQQQQLHVDLQQQQPQLNESSGPAEPPMQQQAGIQKVDAQAASSTAATSGSKSDQSDASNGSWWRIMVGSGVRQLPVVLPSDAVPLNLDDDGSSIGCQWNAAAASRRRALGTAWVYRSPRLTPGTWQLEGPLCTAMDPDKEGPVWECPLLVRLPHNLAAGSPPHEPPPAQQTASSHSRTQASFAAASQADIVHPPGASNNRNNSDPANTWLFSASVGACPAQYWLGQYSGGKFDLVNAMGPLALDGGDALYAPNVLQDKQGRVLLWGWLMELPHRPTSGPSALSTPSLTPPTTGAAAAGVGGSGAAAAKTTQSGCISLPRVLSWLPAGTATSSSSSQGRLHQAPLPELLQLQEASPAAATGLKLLPGAARWVGTEVCTAHCLLSCTLRPRPSSKSHAITVQPGSQQGRLGPAVTAGTTGTGGSSLLGPAAGLLLPGGPGGDAVMLVYDFEAAVLQLQVGAGVGDEWMKRLGPTAPTAAVLEGSGDSHTGGQGAGGNCQPAAVRRFTLQLEGPAHSPLELRVFVDGSVVEVFSGDGQVISTRAYRGLERVAPGASAAGCSLGRGAVLFASAAAARQEKEVAAGPQAVVVADITIGAMRSIW